MTEELKNHRPTLLVVEDDSSLRELLCLSLQRHRYTTLEANDGQEALELFLKDPSAIRAVVTDFSMPRMDGAILIRKIKELNPLFPILLITGEAPDAVILELAHMKKLIVLTKPFRPEALRDSLSLLFKGVRASGESETGEEHGPLRESIRVPVSIPCICQIGDQPGIAGVVQNLSFGGCFIQFRGDVPQSIVEADVPVRFSFQGLEQFAISGAVVWKNTTGMGLSIHADTVETDAFLKRFVLQKLKQQGVGIMGASRGSSATRSRPAAPGDSESS